MADTVAVMNAGRIEQLGAPAELYESPTHHVRRELPRPVQPLRPPRVDRPGRRRAVVDCHGQTLAVPADRLPARRTPDLLRRRPARRRSTSRADADEEPRRATTGSTGGVVVDASFTGVSTQYLVRMPWGQELTVFAQNLGVGERFPGGTPVGLAWERRPHLRPGRRRRRGPGRRGRRRRPARVRRGRSAATPCARRR